MILTSSIAALAIYWSLTFTSGFSHSEGVGEVTDSHLAFAGISQLSSTTRPVFFPVYTFLETVTFWVTGLETILPSLFFSI